MKKYHDSAVFNARTSLAITPERIIAIESLYPGCIMAMSCHKNQCPAGITTQVLSRRRSLDPQVTHLKVSNYNKDLQRELIVLLNALGKRTPRS